MSCGRVSLFTKRIREPLGTVIVRGDTPAADTVKTSVLPLPPPGEGDGLEGDDPPPHVEAIRMAIARTVDGRMRAGVIDVTVRIDGDAPIIIAV